MTESLRERSASDRAGRIPVHVVWEITLACNLKCIHCGSRAGRRRPAELSTAECKDIVRQLAELGTREITLIGGEAYLRRDWLEIAQDIADHGIYCGLQSGARGLTRDRINAAAEAGVRAIGISIDGVAELHDRLRGVSGSHAQAMEAIRNISEAGIAPGVNSQVNALSLPQLPAIFDEILGAGAKYWQVQLTVAMGNAVDNDGLLLQPFQVIEAIDELAKLFHKGRDLGLRVIPGNSIGYFGPHEHHWRSITEDVQHWGGCTAGETTLGLEADGTIKGCPSLPKSHYAGGESRSVSIAEAIRALDKKTVRRDGNRGRSFCGSCYYWSTCRGGCTWVSHVLQSKRGDNPYCYYRATTLARRGLRERIVKIGAAPNEPFAVGTFDIRLEDATGTSVLRMRGLDDKPRKRGRLVLCSSCSEYIYGKETSCPHCGAVQSAIKERVHPAEPVIRALLNETETRATRLLETAAALR